MAAASAITSAWLPPLLWRLLEAEFAAWRRLGHVPQLWWRDDDARVPTPALDRLIALARRTRVPVALAVIPDRDLRPLAATIAGEALVCAIQHGCDHQDRGEPGPSAEFHPDAPPDEVAAKISAAWGRLAAATGAAPVYAPPWNVATPNVVRALAHTPLRALSLYGGDPVDTAGLVALNAHIDIMRWGPARFRGASAILERLRKLLRMRRAAGDWRQPIGFLTHHKNLDPAAWTFLEDLLTRTSQPATVATWRSAPSLLEEFAAPLPLQGERVGR